MPPEFNFERTWLTKFSRCLRDLVGEEIRDIVMEGSETLSDGTEPLEVIHWTQAAVDRLESEVGAGPLQSIMMGCACQYPKSDLQDVRGEYEASGDIQLVHRILQEKFEVFLKDTAVGIGFVH